MTSAGNGSEQARQAPDSRLVVDTIPTLAWSACADGSADFTYMLAGATQRSDSDPNDTTGMPVEVGPHWMIMWPFDPKTTGLATTHKPTGAYIMWAETPYAHVHIMGRP